jgi:hypothetical protein
MGAYGNTSQASRSYLNSAPVLDVDGNGTADALTDGILILRYLFDPAGAWNYSDALGANATRTTRESLKTYLDSGRAGVLDVDGNGTPDALTDGILILRYLFDPGGYWDYSDALGTGATRTSRSEIKAYLDLYLVTLSAAESCVSDATASDSVASSSTEDSIFVPVSTSANDASPMVGVVTSNGAVREEESAAETSPASPIVVAGAQTVAPPGRPGDSWGVFGTSAGVQSIAGTTPTILHDDLFGDITCRGETPKGVDTRALDAILQQTERSASIWAGGVRFNGWINSSDFADDTEGEDLFALPIRRRLTA